MKKLFLKIFILGVLMASVLAFGIPFLKYADDSYEAAAIDKRKLLQNTYPPRIIFIGGSNLAFGLDSKLIKDAIGLPVVNMGLHGGLGLRHNLSEAKPHIAKGDIVVIVPEYEQFFGACFDGTYLTTLSFFNFPQDWKQPISLKGYLSIVKHYPEALGIQLSNFIIKPNPGVIYKRNSFNGYGDNVGYLGKDSPVAGKIEPCEIMGEINKDVVPELNSFKTYVEERGGRVFFIYPSLMDKQYKKNEKKIDLLSETLHNNLKIPIISSPQEYVFPEQYFYDTVYHLNAQGRKIRTQKVIVDLKRVLT